MHSWRRSSILYFRYTYIIKITIYINSLQVAIIDQISFLREEVLNIFATFAP